MYFKNFQYVPAQDDMVIGVVKEKHADNFKVDIGSASVSTLPALSFEGATKKNRPPLQVSEDIYLLLFSMMFF